MSHAGAKMDKSSLTGEVPNSCYGSTMKECLYTRLLQIALVAALAVRLGYSQMITRRACEHVRPSPRGTMIPP